MITQEFIQRTLDVHLEPLRPYMHDKRVQEIMVNPGGHTFIERGGVMEDVGILLTENSIETAIKAVGKMLRKDAQRHSENALINASVGCFRISAGLKPVDPRGSFMCIRVHAEASERPSLEQLIEDKKALTHAQADIIVDLVVNQRRNCIVSGSTGSGKSTLMNALLSKLPPYERIITIEDARELEVTVPNKLSLLANKDEGLTPRMMVQSALRQRPDRLILGETRGDETYDMMRAMNSGHPSMTSIHADNAEQALDALEMLYQQSLPENASMSTEVVRRYIAKSVHVVVHIDRHIDLVDDTPHVVRKVTQICLVKGVTQDGYVLENLA